MPRSLRPLLALALAAASGACGHAPGPADPTARAPAQQGATPAPSASLAADAQFADLVSAAAALEGRELTPGECLLERAPAGFSLRAELAAAVRPLPAPPEDLDQALKGAPRVEVLSGWGRLGEGGAPLALATFTHAAPARAAVVLAVTDQGFQLRPAGTAAVAPLDGLDLGRAVDALRAQPEASVVLTAEARVPLQQLARVLEALADRSAPVLLAVSLAPGTALPAGPSAPRVAPCPDGLPATDAPEGSLPSAALLAGIAPLKEQAPDCLGRGDVRGAAGGRLTLALRVNERGGVQDACIARDELGDPRVAACVIELAQRLSFAAPTPTGVLDLELPLLLRPTARPAQRPLCTVP